MKRVVLPCVTVALLATATATAQPPTPFKLGTFERDARRFVGLVLRDSIVVDIERASAAITPRATVRPPTDMKDLIARYDAELRGRLVEIVRSVAAGTGTKAPYVHTLDAVKVLPPIVLPTTMLNVALNYVAHSTEMAGLNSGPPPLTPGGPPPGGATPDTTSIGGIWERRAADGRWNPYMFMKAPSAVIAEGEAIRLPPGRDQVDWECELGDVIGRGASRVPIDRANDYIFGYTLENDVSDRGGRGDSRYGSDWLIGKSHDTFAPLGPFIVPKEFVPDPRKLKVRFTLNGQLMQDADTSLMIHDVYDQVSFGSHIMTLRPGDVIATGSPAGVGSARKPPIFLKPGDKSVCTYEGVGTLTNPVTR